MRRERVGGWFIREFLMGVGASLNGCWVLGSAARPCHIHLACIYVSKSYRIQGFQNNNFLCCCILWAHRYFFCERQVVCSVAYTFLLRTKKPFRRTRGGVVSPKHQEKPSLGTYVYVRIDACTTPKTASMYNITQQYIPLDCFLSKSLSPSVGTSGLSRQRLEWSPWVALGPPGLLPHR